MSVDIGKALKRGIGAGIGVEAAKLLEGAYKTSDPIDRFQKSVIGGALGSIAYQMVTEKTEEKPKYFVGWGSPT